MKVLKLFKFIRLLIIIVLCPCILICAQAQPPAWDEDIKYDFYNLRWTGLAYDSFNDGTLADFSNILFSALPSQESRKVDMDKVFLPHYMGKRLTKQQKLSEYSLLNFVVRDSQVMTLHSFFLDNTLKICQYWTRIGKGNSADFAKNCNDLRDSIKNYVNKKSFLPSQQGGIQQIFTKCLLPDEKSFVEEWLDKELHDSVFIVKKYDAETCMLALGHYLQFNNAKYFHDFIAQMESKKKQDKFELKFAHIWTLVNALNAFHDTKTYIADAYKDPAKRTEYLGKATHAKKRFIDFAKTALPKNPIDREHRKTEYDLWMKYQKRYKLDSLENKLELTANLISNCQSLLIAANKAEKEERWSDAINNYMELLRDEDVRKIVQPFSHLQGQESCGDLKRIANENLTLLRKRVLGIYLNNIHIADKQLTEASNLNDTLKVLQEYEKSSLLNDDLSGLCLLKIQDLYMQLGDAREHCSEVDTAEFYYKRGLLLANTKMVQTFKEKLYQVEVRKRKCQLDLTPLPAELPDTLKIKIDTNSTNLEKQFVFMHIAQLGKKIMMNDEKEMPLVAHFGSILMENGAIKYTWKLDSNQVQNTLSEMNFAEGKSVGNKHREKLIVNKLSELLLAICQDLETVLDTVEINLVGLADNTRFEAGHECLREKWEYVAKLKGIPILDCYESDPRKIKFFKNLACGSQESKNLALAYLRAFRRKELISEKLSKNMPKHIPIKYRLCGRVNKKEGNEYRGVEVTFIFKPKKNYVFSKKLN